MIKIFNLLMFDENEKFNFEEFNINKNKNVPENNEKIIRESTESEMNEACLNK